MRLALATFCALACAVPNPPPQLHIQGLPAERGGQDLVGQPLPELHFDRWIGPQPDTAGRVVLYRWWTDTCPYCVSSLPAIEQLRQKYGPTGLQVVAVYHPKPVREVRDDDVRAAAQAIGYHGALAVDATWSQLEHFYLSTGNRDATSITVLVDGRGTIRFLHPGPDLFPSKLPAEARQDADFRLLDDAVRSLLGG